MRTNCGVFMGVAVACGLTVTTAAQTTAAKPPAPATQKVPIVAVTGCLKQQGPTDWVLASATEPEASTAGATPATDGAAPVPVLGKRQFKLIGVAEYNLASMKDHTVVIKALHVKAAPMDRLNLTSVQSIGASCGGGR